jgi:hypothetical protein
LEYLGFNARGSWLAACDGRGVYTWNGSTQKLTQAAQSVAGVPLDLQNPSQFMKRYAGRVMGTAVPGGTSAASGAGTAGSGDDSIDPLQTIGLIPGRSGPSAFDTSIGNVSEGTGSRITSGVLTFKDSGSGARISLKVKRPAFLAAQAQMLKAAGNSGPWVWVSDDNQRASVLNVDADGSVKATVVPVQTALSMIGAAAQ